MSFNIPQLSIVFILSLSLSSVYAGDKDKDVNVVNVPGVTVENNASSPVPVEMAANPLADRVQLNLKLNIQGPGVASQELIVPTGKLFEVDHIIVDAVSTDGTPPSIGMFLGPNVECDDVNPCEVRTIPMFGPIATEFVNLPLEQVPSASAAGQFRLIAPVRLIFHDAGGLHTNIQLRFFGADAAASASATILLAGRLVDRPVR